MGNEIERDKSAEIVDAVYKALPAEMFGHRLDAEFNDDGTVTVLVGADAYVLSVKREEA